MKISSTCRCVHETTDINAGGRSLGKGTAHPQANQVLDFRTELCLTLFADGLMYFFMRNSFV
jgi:hypothetical protein